MPVNFSNTYGTLTLFGPVQPERSPAEWKWKDWTEQQPKTLPLQDADAQQYSDTHSSPRLLHTPA